MPEVKHIALFRFRPEVTPEQQQQLLTDLKALPSIIPEIRELAFGINLSQEGLSKGLTHGFIMSFASASDRDTYLNRPEHEQFKARAFELLADVVVLDFEPVL